MRLLLDSHYLLWIANAPERLRARERDLVANASVRHVSAASLWELRLKWSSMRRSGERKLDASPLELLEAARRNQLVILSVTPAHAVAELDPPLPHKDPFDELLLVQAQVEGLRLLTRDNKLLAHPLAIAA